MRISPLCFVLSLCLLTSFTFQHELFADSSAQLFNPVEKDSERLSFSSLPESLQEVVSQTLERDQSATTHAPMPGHQALANNSRQNFHAKFNGQAMSLKTVGAFGVPFPTIVDPIIDTSQKLISDDGENGDSFGIAVAIDGDTALIGSTRHKDSGAVYIFERDGDQWVQKSKLVPADPERGDLFGISVALDGDTAVIGASGDDKAGANAGAAYIFVRHGNTWIQEERLLADDAGNGDAFGGAVDIDGNTVLIGASRRNDFGRADSGAAYVFVRDTDHWVQQAKLLASDAGTGDNFGNAVALDGDTALIGAFRTDDGFFVFNVGTGYIFNRNGETWSEKQLLLASDRGDSDFFGVSVALEGDMAVIGANRSDGVAIGSGAAYVFMNDGVDWVEQAKLAASDGADNDQFGNSVAIGNGLISVGASVDDDLGDASGSVYVFDRADNGSWFEKLKLLPDDGGSNHRFGTSLASDGLDIMTGALGADGNDLADGAAYIFKMFVP